MVTYFLKKNFFKKKTPTTKVCGKSSRGKVSAATTAIRHGQCYHFQMQMRLQSLSSVAHFFPLLSTFIYLIFVFYPSLSSPLNESAAGLGSLAGSRCCEQDDEGRPGRLEDDVTLLSS